MLAMEADALVQVQGRVTSVMTPPPAAAAAAAAAAATSTTSAAAAGSTSPLPPTVTTRRKRPRPRAHPNLGAALRLGSDEEVEEIGDSSEDDDFEGGGALAAAAAAATASAKRRRTERPMPSPGKDAAEEGDEDEKDMAAAITAQLERLKERLWLMHTQFGRGLSWSQCRALARSLLRARVDHNKETVSGRSAALSDGTLAEAAACVPLSHDELVTISGMNGMRARGKVGQLLLNAITTFLSGNCITPDGDFRSTGTEDAMAAEAIGRVKQEPDAFSPPRSTQRSSSLSPAGVGGAGAGAGAGAGVAGGWPSVTPGASQPQQHAAMWGGQPQAGHFPAGGTGAQAAPLTSAHFRPASDLLRLGAPSAEQHMPGGHAAAASFIARRRGEA